MDYSSNIPKDESWPLYLMYDPCANYTIRSIYAYIEICFILGKLGELSDCLSDFMKDINSETDKTFYNYLEENGKIILENNMVVEILDELPKADLEP